MQYKAMYRTNANIGHLPNRLSLDPMAAILCELLLLTTHNFWILYVIFLYE